MIKARKESHRGIFYSIFCFTIFLFLLFILKPQYFLNIKFYLEKPDYYSMTNIYQWTNEDRTTLVYAMPQIHWIGEKEFMTSLLLTAKKMGWNVIPDIEAKNMPKEKLQNAFGIYIVTATQVYNTDFPNIPIFAINNYVEKNLMIHPEAQLKKLIPDQVVRFDKRICGIGLTCYESNLNLELSKSSDHNIKFIMPWFLTAPLSYYQPNPKKLMYAGVNYPHNQRFYDPKYIKLWKKLDSKDYFVLYGPKSSWLNFKSFQGYIPADGQSFVKEINKNGICLIIHNPPHIKEGIPSGRIFEAAAAAAVIISDKHPFVEREFKDSVLYVDQTREDLFEQIDAHMQWIKKHPSEAKAKARLAHAIFVQKFTAEAQLARLYENIQRLKNEKAVSQN